MPDILHTLTDPKTFYRAILKSLTEVERYHPFRYTIEYCPNHDIHGELARKGIQTSGLNISLKAVQSLRDFFKLLSEYTSYTFEEVGCADQPNLYFLFETSLSFQNLFFQAQGGVTKRNTLSFELVEQQGNRLSTTYLTQPRNVILMRVFPPYVDCINTFTDYCTNIFFHEVYHGLGLDHPVQYGRKQPPYLPDAYNHQAVTQLSYRPPPRGISATATDAWRLWYQIFALEERSDETSIKKFLTLLDIEALNKHPIYGGKNQAPHISQHVYLHDMQTSVTILPSTGMTRLTFSQYNPYSKLYLDLKGGVGFPSQFGDLELFIASHLRFSKIELPNADTTMILPETFPELEVLHVSQKALRIYFPNDTGSSNRFVLKKGVASCFFPEGSWVNTTSSEIEPLCDNHKAIVLRSANTTAYFCEASPAMAAYSEIPSPITNIWQLISFLYRAYTPLLPVTYYTISGFVTSMLPVFFAFSLGRLSQLSICQRVFTQIEQYASSDKLAYGVVHMAAGIAVSHYVPLRYGLAYRLGQLSLIQKSTVREETHMATDVAVSEANSLSKAKQATMVSLFVLGFVLAAELFLDVGLSLSLGITVLSIVLGALSTYQAMPKIQSDKPLARVALTLWQPVESVLEACIPYVPGHELFALDERGSHPQP